MANSNSIGKIAIRLALLALVSFAALVLLRTLWRSVSRKALCECKIADKYSLELVKHTFAIEVPRFHLFDRSGRDLGVQQDEKFPLTGGDSTAVSPVSEYAYRDDRCTIKSARLVSESNNGEVQIEVTFENERAILIFMKRDK